MSKLISLSELPAKTVSTDDIRCVTSSIPDDYDKVIVTFSFEETQRAFYHELIQLIYNVNPEFLFEDMKYSDELCAACGAPNREYSIPFEEVWAWFDTDNSLVMQVLAEWNKYLAEEESLHIMQNNMLLKNTPHTIPFSTDTKVIYYTEDGDCYSVQCCDKDHACAVTDI